MFDRATFYAYLRKSTLFDHGLSQRQVVGTEAILNAWDKSGYADERWLAYALGTTYHETGRAMSPVREGGRGKGHPYGKPTANGQVAYGRGYVQLTWAGPAPYPDNYAKADKALGLGGKLVANYDLALDPDIAAQILLRGMTEGWFTAFRLSDYLNDHLADWLHCRRIVNGMDRAEMVAGYARVFYEAIVAAEHHVGSESITPKTNENNGVNAKTASESITPDDPLASLEAAIGQVASAATSILPGGPSPAAPGAPSATDEPESNDIMEILATLANLFSGAAGKIGVAGSIASELPHLVTGTIANISEVPKAVAAIEKLVADIKAGKWSDAPADVHAVVAEFEAILKNYGVNLPALTSMVDKLPTAPAITKA